MSQDSFGTFSWEDGFPNGAEESLADHLLEVSDELEAQLHCYRETGHESYRKRAEDLMKLGKSAFDAIKSWQASPNTLSDSIGNIGPCTQMHGLVDITREAAASLDQDTAREIEQNREDIVEYGTLREGTSSGNLAYSMEKYRQALERAEGADGLEVEVPYYLEQMRK